jgi:hypothetical protein
VSYSGKNSADIRLVVDALDLCYMKRHVDTFVVISGDSDFSPLVSKLRENDKRVIGLGVKSSSSHLLIDNCDEFIYYDDLVRARGSMRRSEAGTVAAPKGAAHARVRTPSATTTESAEMPAVSAPSATAVATPTGTPDEAGTGKPLADRQREAIELILDVVEALFQDRDGALHGSLVKQTIKRKRPEFSERFHGYRTFSDILEDAAKRGLLELAHDDKSGGYVVTAFGPKA